MMLLLEVLVGGDHTLARRGDAKLADRPRALLNAQTKMTINALSTMAIAFAVGAGALLVLAGSSLNEAVVAGAVATAVAFINLVRRPPEEPSGVTGAN